MHDLDTAGNAFATTDLTPEDEPILRKAVNIL
jgi:hypothetical protein